MKHIFVEPRWSDLSSLEFNNKKEFYIMHGLQVCLPKLSKFYVIPYFKKKEGVYQITNMGKRF